MVACRGDGPLTFTGSWCKSVNTTYAQRPVCRTFRLVRTFEGRFQGFQDVSYRLVKSEFSHLPQQSHIPRHHIIVPYTLRYRQILPNGVRSAKIDSNRPASPMISTMCTKRSAWFGHSRIVSIDFTTSPIDWASQNFVIPHNGDTTSGTT